MEATYPGIGVVDENVEAAKLAHGEVDRGLPGVGAGHIQMDVTGPVTEVGCGLLPDLVKNVSDDDGCAFCDEALRPGG